MTMNDETIQNLLMKVVDGLATPEEEAALQEAIQADSKWKGAGIASLS